MASRDLLVTGQIAATVSCSFVETTTCFWLALTIDTIISVMLRDVISPQLEPGLRLIISRLVLDVVVVYRTAALLNALIWTLIMTSFLQSYFTFQWPVNS